MSGNPYRVATSIVPTESEELARAAIHRDLASDEELLWVGRAPQGQRSQSTDAVQIPFMTLWTSFACFWEYNAWAEHAPWPFRLWGLPFVAVGLYGLIGRYFVDARRRSHTFYGITNRRALLVVEASTRQLTSIDLERTEEISLEERSDGTGSILFGRATLGGTGKGRQPSHRPRSWTFRTRDRSLLSCKRRRRERAQSCSAPSKILRAMD